MVCPPHKDQIKFEEYKNLHARISKTIQPSFSSKDAESAAKEDWKADVSSETVRAWATHVFCLRCDSSQCPGSPGSQGSPGSPRSRGTPALCGRIIAALCGWVMRFFCAQVCLHGDRSGTLSRLQFSAAMLQLVDEWCIDNFPCPVKHTNHPQHLRAASIARWLGHAFGTLMANAGVVSMQALYIDFLQVIFDNIMAGYEVEIVNGKKKYNLTMNAAYSTSRGRTVEMKFMPINQIKGKFALVEKLKKEHKAALMVQRNWRNMKKQLLPKPAAASFGEFWGKTKEEIVYMEKVHRKRRLKRKLRLAFVATRVAHAGDAAAATEPEPAHMPDRQLLTGLPLPGAAPEPPPGPDAGVGAAAGVGKLQSAEQTLQLEVHCRSESLTGGPNGLKVKPTQPAAELGDAREGDDAKAAADELVTQHGGNVGNAMQLQAATSNAGLQVETGPLSPPPPPSDLAKGAQIPQAAAVPADQSASQPLNTTGSLTWARSDMAARGDGADVLQSGHHVANALDVGERTSSGAQDGRTSPSCAQDGRTSPSGAQDGRTNPGSPSSAVRRCLSVEPRAASQTVWRNHFAAKLARARGGGAGSWLGATGSYTAGSPGGPSTTTRSAFPGMGGCSCCRCCDAAAFPPPVLLGASIGRERAREYIDAH